jgi:uncharacterized repeat protein (TIGR01451 family)
MARLTHPAVKWMFVSSLLAASGAGVCAYTPAGAWVAKLVGRGGPEAELVAEDAPVAKPAAPSHADLDAVADAWAAAKGDRCGKDAEPAKEEAERPAASAADPVVVHDEHVVPAAYVAPADAADREISSQLTSKDSTKAEAVVDKSASGVATDDRYATRETRQPTQIDFSTVTRGQAPDDGRAADITPIDDNPPKPLPASNRDTHRGASSERAREAFGDTHATAPISADDRYSGTSAGGARDRSAGADPALSNPFGPQPTLAATNVDSATSLPAPSARPMPTTAAASPASGNLGGPASFDPARAQAEPIRAASSAYGAGALDNAAPRRSPAASGAPDSTYSSRGPSSYSQPTAAEGTGRPAERALEGVQKPSLVIQKFAPPEIQVGKPAKFRVQIRNVGGQTASDVVIRDEVPQGTRLVSTTPKADVDGTHLIWQIGALSTGEEKTVEIELMPTTEGDIGSVAAVTFAAQASAKAHCTMPQLAIRMTAPSQVMIGQDEHVKIELRNPGTGDATNVMLLENVPENVRHPAGPALEFEVGTLKAGETRSMDLVLTAQKAGKVVNALTARADGNLQVQQQVEFEVIAPGLQVSVDGPEKRYLERPATYQVSVQNPGTAPAHDIELVTKLPKGMKFVKANNMGQYDAASHAVYWSLAELPEGEKGTVELVAMPVEAGSQTLEVQGKAQQGLSDQTKREVMVEGLSAIMFEVRDSEDPIEINGETTYDIRVMNQGSKAATNVQVVVSLPAGLQFVSASGETHFSGERGGIVFEPLKQLAPKADTVYRVTVKGVQPGDQRVTVQVSTDDINQPIRREESTRVFGDQ